MHGVVWIKWEPGSESIFLECFYSNKGRKTMRVRLPGMANVDSSLGCYSSKSDYAQDGLTIQVCVPCPNIACIRSFSAEAVDTSALRASTSGYFIYLWHTEKNLQQKDTTDTPNIITVSNLQKEEFWKNGGEMASFLITRGRRWEDQAYCVCAMHRIVICPGSL